MLPIPKSPSTEPPLLTSYALAQLLSVSLDTIKRWRSEGKGPSFAKLNRAVRYRMADVTQFLDAAVATSMEGD